MVVIDKVILYSKPVIVFAGADNAVADDDDGHIVPSSSNLVKVPTVPVTSTQAPPQLYVEHVYSLIPSHPEPSKRVPHSPEPSRRTLPRPDTSLPVTPNAWTKAIWPRNTGTKVN